MTASIEGSFNQAFILDEAALRHLVQIFDLIGKDKIICSITTKDQISVEYENINEILRISNDKNNPIKEIQFLRFKDSQTSFYIHLTTSRTFSIHYRLVTQDQKDMMIVKKHLEAWRNEIKPWYSVLATANLVVFMLVPTISIVLVYLLLFSLRAILGINIRIGEFALNIFWITIMLFLSLFGSTFFPVATFAIGYGIKRHQNFSNLRQFIGITVISGIIISLIANLLIS